MAVLEINNLIKRYGSITAVNNLSLEVEEGNIFGILGPNGSGKTTTLGTILGIIKADSGTYSWFNGKYGDSDEARKHIGALLETPNFYPYLNAIDNMDIIAHIKKADKSNLDDLLKLVNLYDRRFSSFQTYSLGMKQRLAIAGALVGDPDVLIFDEPTNGLDPEGIAEVRDTIKKIAARGKTIFMASHILVEVEKVCTHVAIIKNGNLLAVGNVGSIINQDAVIEVAGEDNQQIINLLSPLDMVTNIELIDGVVRFNLDEDYSTLDINMIAIKNNIVLTHLVTKQKSLEDEFLEITK